jgi:predicted MPP superfamily phosphohydrolase
MVIFQLNNYIMNRSYFLIVILLLTRLTGFCQPAHIHLSWNNSQLTGTQKSMALTWSDSISNTGMVKYGIDKSLTKTIQVTGVHSSLLNSNIFKTTLNSLKKNTMYFYQCGSDKTGWSNIYSFTTAPDVGSKSKFVVGVWSDTQDNEFNTRFEKSEIIKQQMLKYPIKFSIHMGDIVDNGSMARRWKGYFTMAQSLNANAPFMPVPGNHDVDNKKTDSIFQTPFPIFYEQMNLPGSGIDYSYNYGNTHFVAVCSGHAKGVEDAGLTSWRFAKGTPEYDWLDADLAKARKNKNITWIIIYMHHPPYAFGVSQVKGWQETITGVIDKYKVDLCLSGHRHVYERHAAIYNGAPLAQSDKSVYNKPAGTVYITNGTSGGSPQGVGGKDMPGMIYTSPTRMYNYAMMAIEGNTINYDVYNDKGEIIDHFTLTK